MAKHQIANSYGCKLPYNESGRSISCKFEDFSRIDFHDWITIGMLLCHLLQFDLNIVSVWWGAYERFAIGVPFLGNHNE